MDDKKSCTSLIVKTILNTLDTEPDYINSPPAPPYFIKRGSYNPAPSTQNLIVTQKVIKRFHSFKYTDNQSRKTSIKNIFISYLTGNKVALEFKMIN